MWHLKSNILIIFQQFQHQQYVNHSLKWLSTYLHQLYVYDGVALQVHHGAAPILRRMSCNSANDNTWNKHMSEACSILSKVWGTVWSEMCIANEQLWIKVVRDPVKDEHQPCLFTVQFGCHFPCYCSIVVVLFFTEPAELLKIRLCRSMVILPGLEHGLVYVHLIGMSHSWNKTV